MRSILNCLATLMLAQLVLTPLVSGQAEPRKPLRVPSPAERDGPGSDRNPSTPPGSRLNPDLTQDPNKLTSSLFARWWADNRWAYIGTRRRTPSPITTAPSFLANEQWRQEQRDSWREDAIEALLHFVDHADQRLRGAALASLGQLGHDDINLLQRALFGDTELVSELALLGAGSATLSPHTYHLLRLASGFSDLKTAAPHHENWQHLAALFLSLRGERILAPILREQVMDRQQPVTSRRLGTMALALDGSDDIAPLLLDFALERKENGAVRCAALDGLGRLQATQFADEIVSILVKRDPDADVRLAAAIAVGSVVDASNRTQLRQLHRHLEQESNLAVRLFLMLSLGKIGGPDAELILYRKLNDRRGEERVFASLGLGLLAQKTKSDSATELLLSSYQRCKSLDERLGFMAALGLTQDSRVLRELSIAVESGDAASLRRRAAEALAILGDPQAETVLKQCLQEEADPSVFAQVAASYGILSPTATISLLRTYSSKHDAAAHWRTPIISAFGETKDPQALPILLELLTQSHLSVDELEAALLAVGRIYDPQLYRPLSPLGFHRNYLRENLRVDELLTRLPAALR